mgnify:CR=1 FL=1
MRPNKVLLFFAALILFAPACITGNPLQPTPAAAPTEALTITPSPTRTAIPSPLPAYPTGESIPLWVTDFADPILAEVADRKPDFEDDFSRNRGWLNMMPGLVWPLYAERYDGMLFLRLPEGTKDSILYNSRINRRNFVLTLEFRFVHNQPDDAVRFQFSQPPDQSIAFDFSNNRNWKFQWGSENNLQSTAGIYDHFPPERIPLTIIMNGTQCAVYLNSDPLTYSSNCRINPLHESAVTFRLLSDNGSDVTANFDNLNLWDLDNIPNLP